jgi:hypothetical protein
MAVTRKRLFAPALLGNSAGNYYTAGTGVRTLLTKIVFANTDSSDRSVSVHLVPAGDPPAPANLLVKEKPVYAGETVGLPEIVGLILNPGDSLQAFADLDSKVVIHGGGVEIV